MNRDQKRFRQINIFQSFANCKKPKTTAMSTKEQKRELMASAAENRLQPSKKESVPEKELNPTSLKSNLQELLLVTNNNDSTVLKDEKGTCNESTQLSSSFQISQNELREINTSSQELFPDSGEIFQSSEELLPDIEEYSSQQSTSSLNAHTLSLSEQSQEIFSVSENAEIQSTEIDAVESDVDEAVMYINKKPDCSIPLPKLEPLENHTIMFFPHIRPGDAPRPFPSFYKDCWDCDHIRMPCSPQNRFPVEDLNGEKQIKSRWELICQSLRRPILTSSQLEDAIMSYNLQYRGRWNFHSLHTFFNNCFAEEELSHFFQNLLPAMINMALNLPKICTQPLPLLKKNKDHYVTLSQKQVGCLLLNAFFCTFPRRNFVSRNMKLNITSEYATYPDINFNRLYYGVKNKVSLRNLEKLKCLINYFRRITSQEPSGTITFHRQSLKEIPEWHESTRGLSTVVIKSDGLIESDGHGMLQVDFANKFVGGGVLGQGCVQEEIRFIICPELIVSRLFVECLAPNEVLLITGVEQYNKYSGYGDTFKWEGNFKDHTQRDAWGRRLTEVVAMDATHFRNTLDQFQPVYIKKELTKALCGFYEDAPPGNLCAVATGNWGCGAFKGNPTLKFLIQLLACSEAKREMVYFTFGNKVLKKELSSIYSLLIDKNLTVGDLWRILLSYSGSVKVIRNESCPKLYDYLISIFAQEGTDDGEMLSTCQRLILAVENDSDTDIEENNNKTLLNDHG